MTEYSVYEDGAPHLTGTERELFDAVSKVEPWNLVETFSKLDRKDGSEGQRKAAEYITDRLTDLEIPYTRHDPEILSTLPQSASVRVIGTDGEDEHWDDISQVKPELFTAPNSITAPVTVIEEDLGGPHSFSGVEDLDVDVAGKIVILKSLPVTINTKLTLESEGAIGTIAVHPFEDKTSWGRVSSEQWGAVPQERNESESEFVGISVSKQVGNRLIHLARREESLEVEITADVRREWVSCPLVVSRIEGTADPASDEFVLLHAHYDSWYEGVTDNATGDAGILECANVLNEFRDQLKRDLWVCWWPGHSQASYAGSAWFVDEYSNELVENCVCHVNMDGPGAELATEFTEAPVWMAEGESFCKDVISDVTGKESSGGRPVRAGDYSFNNLGVTGLFMNVSNVPPEVREERGWVTRKDPERYHQPTDTIEKADPDILVRDVRVFVVLLHRLLSAEVLPLDHRTTLEEHREILRQYDEDAGDLFDLSPLLSELEALEGEVTSLYDKISDSDIAPSTANTAITELSRALVRSYFTERGQFDQDSTLFRSPYPKLTDVQELDRLSESDRRIVDTHLKRSRNEIRDRLYDVRMEIADLQSSD